MASLATVVMVPLGMLCICKKSVRRRWREMFCCWKGCPLYVDAPKLKADRDLENGRLKTTKMTDYAEDFHQIGHVPSHWASR